MRAEQTEIEGQRLGAVRDRAGRRVAGGWIGRVLLGFVCQAALQLTGCGIGGTPVTTVPPGMAMVSPTAVSFPATTVGSSSAVSTVTLKNTGGEALSMAAAVLSDAVDFGVTTTCTASLAAGASCGYTVVFKPQSAGDLTGTLTLSESSAAGGNATQQVVALSGDGTVLPVSAATVSPGRLVFASTTVGTVSAAQTVMVTNSGTAALAIAGVALSDTADFAVSSTCGATLAAGASCALSVVYQPQSVGSSSAVLTLTDNSGGMRGATQTVSLTGTGMPVPEPGAVVAPGSLVFGKMAVGAMSAAQTVTLRNPGTAALSIASVAASDTADFQVQSGCGTTLAAGASCAIQVVFAPGAVGALQAVLTVTDNNGGSSGATQTVSLAGTGVPAPEPVASVSPGSVAFGQTSVGKVSAAQTVTLQNSGTAALAIAGMAVSDSVDFAVQNGCGATLAAGASCAIGVIFKPQTAGALSAVLTVTDNSDGAAGAPQTVQLSGMGLAVPQAVLSVGSLGFPHTMVTVGSAAQTVMLSNPGTGPLAIAGVAVSDAADFVVSSTCGATLAAGASCGISVVFQPQAVATDTAMLTVTDNSGLSGAGTVQQVVGLSGTGIAFAGPKAAVSPATLQFPGVLAGQSDPPMAVTLSSTGTEPLAVSGVSLGAGSASGYAVTANDCPATLPVGASCTVTVGYAPAVPSASDTGSLVMANNGLGQGGGTQTVALTGKAWAEVDAVTNFGDSITCGFYAEPNDGTGTVWSLEGYSGLLDAWLNLPFDAVCRHGDEAADMSRLWVPFNSTPKLGGYQLYTAMVGANDAYLNGSPPAWVTAYGAEMGAAVAWMAIPAEHKVLANAMTQATGSWSAGAGFGLVSTQPGSSLSFTANQAIAGENLYVVYQTWAAAGVQGGTVAIVVDGVSQATVTASDPGFGGTQNGTTDTYLLARVPLGAVGAHTVTLTHTGAAGTTVGVLWAGVPQANYGMLAGAPRVMVGAITTSPSGNQAYQASVYNVQLRATVASLAADGLYVEVVPTDTALDPGTDFADLLHPNTAGHAKLAAVFEEYR